MRSTPWRSCFTVFKHTDKKNTLSLASVICPSWIRCGVMTHRPATPRSSGFFSRDKPVWTLWQSRGIRETNQEWLCIAFLMSAHEEHVGSYRAKLLIFPPPSPFLDVVHRKHRKGSNQVRHGSFVILPKNYSITGVAKGRPLATLENHTNRGVTNVAKRQFLIFATLYH